MKPFVTSGRASRSFTISLVMSSVTSPPASMIAWTFLPIGVPRALWSRNMSPVETWGTLSSEDRSFACVPLPAPGGPRRIRIMALSSARAAARRPAASRVRDLAGRDPPPADARAARAGEALVVAGDEVAFDLLHGVERHADDDEERGPAEVELDVGLVRADRRQHADSPK